MIKQFQKYLPYVTLLILLGCDGGLNPENSSGVTGKTILHGRIIYKGGPSAWPAKDSVFAIRAVAFKTYPPKDILNEVISGNAYFTLETLPLFVDSSDFELEIPDAPVSLKYIAIAQQYTDSITSQKAVGVYTLSGDNTKPSAIAVEKGRTYNIRINVDFSNLPPQPFN